MASVSQRAAARPLLQVIGRGGLVDKYFYFTMAILAAAIVVWGFSYTVNPGLFHPAVLRPLILWFHATVFSGWVVFFIFQSLLVRTHNVKWHRFFGWFGVVLGTVIVPLGVATAIVMGRFDTYTLHKTGRDAFLIDPLVDMARFATFFALAVWWRRKPESHRRLIFIATCVLLDAAFGRIDFLFGNNLFFPCLDVVIVLGVLRDLLVNRRIHKIYLAALPMLVVAQAFVVYTWWSGAGWRLRIAHAMLGLRVRVARSTRLHGACPTSQSTCPASSRFVN